jgi:hypothetical protein
VWSQQLLEFARDVGFLDGSYLQLGESAVSCAAFVVRCRAVGISRMRCPWGVRWLLGTRHYGGEGGETQLGGRHVRLWSEHG